MPKAVHMQTSLVGGEISPILDARVDFEKYANGCQILENFLVHPQGGVMRRSGFACMGETKNSSAPSILTSFVYANGSAFVLEMGAGYIRFYKDGTLVPRPNAPETPLEVPTPYGTEDPAELGQLRFCQSADILYITHPAHAPAMLCRYADDNWTLTRIPLTGGPYREENTTPFTVQASAKTGSVTLRSVNLIGNGYFQTGMDGWLNWSTGEEVSAGDGVLRLDNQEAGEELWVTTYVTARVGKSYRFSLDAVCETGSLEVYVKPTLGSTYAYQTTLTASGSLSQDITIRSLGTSLTTLVTIGFRTTGTWEVDNVVLGYAMFHPGHAGALWKIGKRDYDNVVETTFTQADQKGTYMQVSNQTFMAILEDQGGWSGTMVLEKSWDAATFTKCKEYTAGNVSVELPEEETVYYRWRCSARTSGSVKASIKTIQAIPKGEVRIDTYLDPCSVEATVLSPLPTTDPTPVWWEGAWSGYRGFPSLACFYDDRMIFAKGATVYGSQTSDYYNFSVSSSALDSDALEFTLLSRRQNAITWMEPARRLMLGTAGGEWWISGSDDRSALSPANVLAKQDSFYGGEGTAAVRIANTFLFLQKHGRHLYDLSYSLDQDAFTATDLSILASHLTGESPIHTLAYQQNPGSILWACRQDGVLLSLTYQRQHDVAAWSRHTTQGEFESICVIPGEARDELWAIVKRRINGAVKRFVERMAPDFYGEENAVDGVFLDCHRADNSAWCTPGAVNSPLMLYSHVQTFNAYLAPGGYELWPNWSGQEPTKFFRGDLFAVYPGYDYMFNFTSEDVGKTYRLAQDGLFLDATVTSVNSSGYCSVMGLVSGNTHTLFDGVRTAHWARLDSTLSGLDHLEGQSVCVMVDGQAQSDKTVASGTITLDSPGATLCAGLPYTSTLQTVRLEAGAADGTAQGRTKRITRATARVLQTMGGEWGADQETLLALAPKEDYEGLPRFLEPALFKYPPRSQYPPVFTGDITVDWPGGFETDGRVLIRQSQPYPMTILGIITHLETFGR